MNTVEFGERADAKGLYDKGRDIEVSRFADIAAPYEESLSPEISVDTDLRTLAE